MKKFTVTSELKKTNGLVDFLADGLVEGNEDGEMVPCKIGFTQWDEDEEPEATHIFIDDVITKNGNHYNKETIRL